MAFQYSERDVLIKPTWQSPSMEPTKVFSLFLKPSLRSTFSASEDSKAFSNFFASTMDWWDEKPSLVTHNVIHNAELRFPSQLPYWLPALTWHSLCWMSRALRRMYWRRTGSLYSVPPERSLLNPARWKSLLFLLQSATWDGTHSWWRLSRPLREWEMSINWRVWWWKSQRERWMWRELYDWARLWLSGRLSNSLWCLYLSGRSRFRITRNHWWLHSHRSTDP